GIRDFHVTGVQTCALPIFIAVGLGVFSLMLLSNGWSSLTTWAQLRFAWSLNHYLSSQLLARYLRRPYAYFLSRNTADLSKNILRSEERRVGKECGFERLPV